MMVNWSLCVEAYEPAIRVWTWWFRDGFRYFYDFWKLGLGMLPPFLCYQNAHTFHWSLFRSANHQESILQKRNHSNYPGCCPHEILSGSLQYWSSNFTPKILQEEGSIVRTWSSSNRIPNRSGPRWAQPVPQSHWAWWTGALLSQQDHRPGGFNRLKDPVVSTPSERRCGIIIPGLNISVWNNPPNITKFCIDSNIVLSYSHIVPQCAS